MDGVGEFMDEDIFVDIGIAGEVEEVLLGTTDGWADARGPQAARPPVPEFSRRQVPMLRNVRGPLRIGHDRAAHLVLDQGSQNVRALGQHLLDQVSRLQDCVIRCFFRTDHRKAADAYVLLVKGIEFPAGGRNG